MLILKTEAWIEIQPHFDQQTSKRARGLGDRSTAVMWEHCCHVHV